MIIPMVHTESKMIIMMVCIMIIMIVVMTVVDGKWIQMRSDDDERWWMRSER